jgi:hypothetical protein
MQLDPYSGTEDGGGEVGSGPASAVVAFNSHIKSESVAEGPELVSGHGLVRPSHIT